MNELKKFNTNFKLQAETLKFQTETFNRTMRNLKIIHGALEMLVFVLIAIVIVDLIAVKVCRQRVGRNSP